MPTRVRRAQRRASEISLTAAQIGYGVTRDSASQASRYRVRATMPGWNAKVHLHELGDERVRGLFAGRRPRVATCRRTD